jgi:hypothetical protein
VGRELLMTTTIRRFAAVAGLVLFATLLTPLTAAAQQHLPIVVEHVGEDAVGKKYVEDLGARLRSSKRYDITISKDDALLGLHLVSTDANDKEAGAASAIAITMTLGPAQAKTYMHTWVILVGRDRTEDMANALIGAIDAAVAQLKRQRTT